MEISVEKSWTNRLRNQGKRTLNDGVFFTQISEIKNILDNFLVLVSGVSSDLYFFSLYLNFSNLYDIVWWW